MAYVRKYKTDEELLEARREAMKAARMRSVEVRKAAADARKGEPPKPKTNNTTMIGVRLSDKYVFDVVASSMKIPRAELLHTLADGLRSANTELFNK